MNIVNDDYYYFQFNEEEFLQCYDRILKQYDIKCGHKLYRKYKENNKNDLTSNTMNHNGQNKCMGKIYGSQIDIQHDEKPHDIFMPTIDENNNNAHNNNDNDSNIHNNDNISLNEVVESDTLGLQSNGYNKFTLINNNEYVPNIDYEFDQWLYFSKKLWKRQQKYKRYKQTMVK